jgi:hypothetical protein
MATPKQIAANRENAKKSTGPRTPEGKAKTRLNAKRDGLTGQVITLAEEDLPYFENFKDRFIADLRPENMMEVHLAHAIAWDTWRLNHLRATEMNLFALGAGSSEADAALNIDCGDRPEVQTAVSHTVTQGKELHRLALMSLYEQRLNRAIHKNLQALRSLQAERIANYKNDLAEEARIASYNLLNDLPYKAPTTRTINGSVFSNSEIFEAAERQTKLGLTKHPIHRPAPKAEYDNIDALIAKHLPRKESPTTQAAPDNPTRAKAA